MSDPLLAARRARALEWFIQLIRERRFVVAIRLYIVGVLLRLPTIWPLLQLSDWLDTVENCPVCLRGEFGSVLNMGAFRRCPRCAAMAWRAAPCGNTVSGCPSR